MASGATDSGRPTAVIAAMQEELAPLLSRTQIEHRRALDGCEVTWGRLGQAHVVLARTAEGRAGATRGVESLLESVPVERLLVIGVSGGLTSTLERGRLLVGRRVLHGGDVAPAPDPRWIDQALCGEGVLDGTIVCTPRILCTPGSKAELREELGETGPTAVDLETAAYAEAAAACGVPYLAVRAVYDTADEELPLDFNLFRDASGRIRRGRVVRHALLHPRVIGRLRELQQRVSDCANRLAAFVYQLLNEVER